MMPADHIRPWPLLQFQLRTDCWWVFRPLPDRRPPWPGRHSSVTSFRKVLQKTDKIKIQQRRTRRNKTLNVGDNYGKIETAMAKIEREGNHPDETWKCWPTFSRCARMRRSNDPLKWRFLDENYSFSVKSSEKIHVFMYITANMCPKAQIVNIFRVRSKMANFAGASTLNGATNPSIVSFNSCFIRRGKNSFGCSIQQNIFVDARRLCIPWKM